jgi:sugar phosphate isomerase/epimerase
MNPANAAIARRRHRVGIDNYGLFPLNFTPLVTLRWAEAHRAEGVAFSGLQPEHQAALDAAALDRLKGFAGDRGLYLEWGGAQHVPRDLATWSRKDIREDNREMLRQAVALGARIVRSCSGGLMRWQDDAPPTETLLRETAEALRAQAAMWQDAGVTLAIETHFEFTSFELLRLLDMCEAPPGGWLGVCLDTMNLLTMLEEPVAATRRLLPWVVSTHIKDGAAALGPSGFTTFTTPIGAGVIDIPAIADLLSSLDRPVHFSVEDHGGSFLLPIFDPTFLSKFPDLTVQELASLTALAERAARTPSCTPLPREEWPRVAEARMAANVTSLAALIEGRRASAGSL